MKRAAILSILTLLSICNISGCGKKEDITPTFEVVETQDLSEFEVNEEISLDSSPSTLPEQENIITEQELEELEQDLAQSGTGSVGLEVYGKVSGEMDEIEQKLTEEEKQQLDKIVTEKSTNYEEIISKFSSLNDEEEQSVINSMKNQLEAGDPYAMPEELKNSINEQNQKSVDEYLKILEDNFNSQEAGE